MRHCVRRISLLSLFLVILVLVTGCARNSEPESRTVLIGDGSGPIYIRGIKVKAPYDKLDENLRKRTPDTAIFITDDVMLLADGSLRATSSRHKLPQLDKVISLSEHFAVRNDGTLWQWEMYGESSKEYLNLEQIKLTKPAQEVESCRSRWIVLNRDATVAVGGWSSEKNVDLGLSDVRTISISLDCSNFYVIKSDGSVWGWGDNSYGQLGTQLDSTSVNVPVPVVTGKNITHLAAGRGYVLFLDDNGRVYGLGQNNIGQLGNGSFDDAGSLSEVSALSDVIAIGTSFSGSRAVTSNNDLYVWGNMNEKYSPFAPYRPESLGMYPLVFPVKITTEGNFIDIAVSHSSNLALHKNGSVWAWGSNAYGQLGVGHLRTISTPTKIDGLETVVDVVTATGFSCALKDDGAVWCWGVNSLLPVKISNLASITQLVAREDYALALDQQGAIWVLKMGEVLMSLSDFFPAAEAVYVGISDFIIKLKDGSYWTLNGGNEDSYSMSFPNPKQLDQVPMAVFEGVPLRNGELVFNRSGDIVLADSIGSHEGLEDYISIAFWASGYGSDVILDTEGRTWVNTSAPTGFGRGFTEDVFGVQSLPLDWVPRMGVGLMAAFRWGSGHLVSLDHDGNIWTVGYNQSGQLGNGEILYSAVPVLR